jgi:hypothetical protein
MKSIRLRLLSSSAAVAAVAGTAIFFAAEGGGASTPSSSVAVTSNGAPTVSWSGTAPAGSHPTNDCNGAGAGTDEHQIALKIPAKGYDRFNATFTFKIAWTPGAGGETAHDLILTVNGPDLGDQGDTSAAEIGSSDGGDPEETVIAHNLGAGTYHVLACGYANASPQAYKATLTVKTAPATDETVRSAPAQGLAFSAAVPTDAQRDEAEPLIEISRDGHIYTCGPTGFSNASDYAQVSIDHGEQFHLLGTPPRGQQGAGGGGDCGLATGAAKNAGGSYQYAYSGLGALSGFATSTSADDGHSIAAGGANVSGGVTSQGALADRQWMVFTDARTVLLTYNQQQPRNAVIQKSTDGGLTYSPVASVAAPNPEFPGPLRYIDRQKIVYMPWTKGEEVNLSISKDGGSTWTSCVVAKGPTVAGGTAGFAVADNDEPGNVYVVWADSSNYHSWLSVLPAAKVAGCNEPVSKVASDKDSGGQPVVNAGFTKPVQVDRDAVRTTVFPWVAASGDPGRVAVTFYGTESDGDPNVGTFKAAWDVYVNQSLDALDASRSFSQVRATTHPFHNDSICLNGLGCDLAAPAGDRTLADFFAIGYNRDDKRLYVVFDRTNKKPDEALGHIATPMVLSQIDGPSNGGGRVDVSGRDPVRSATGDPTGDALSGYSLTAPGTAPPEPPIRNEAAADFTGVAVAGAPDGGLTVTMQLTDLSPGALTAALADTAGQSLQWIWRFANGYQDAGASASWNPATGWKFGFDGYTTGGGVCDSLASGEKCQVYPQKTTIPGKVDVAKKTITLQIPRSLLRQLSGEDKSGRPLEKPATVGGRIYDGTAFSVANNVSPTQAHQTFLYPLDNTAPMDVRLPKATSAATAQARTLDLIASILKTVTDTVASAGGTVEKVVPSTVSPKVQPPTVELPPLPKGLPKLK